MTFNLFKYNFKKILKFNNILYNKLYQITFKSPHCIYINMFTCKLLTAPLLQQQHFGIVTNFHFSKLIENQECYKL